VTWERDLGVDVEWTARMTGGVHLARRYFSSAEVAELESVEESRQRDRFFDYWTLKEAYIKACGKGLAIPLGQFSFCLADPKRTTIAFGPKLADDPAAWQFAQWSPSPEHRMSVAVRRGATRDLRMRVRATTPIA
jgi:4'-phosphopantetheinyl transferase